MVGSRASARLDHVWMTYPAPFAARTDLEQSIVERARAAATVAGEHATEHDRAGTFPVEGLKVLAESGYLSLVVPREHGGEGAGVPALALGNLELAKGDASLALVVGMHHALLGRVRDAGVWPAATFERVCREIVEAGQRGQPALINSLATEPEMGSPSRGGLPRTRAERVAHGWRLNGRKSFSSGSSVLHWATIAATVEQDGGPQVGSFLVPLDRPGVRIEHSWDVLGMRASESHTVVLEDVDVPEDAILPRPESPSHGGTVPNYERAWSLSISAVYLGAAEAARDFAIRFARNRRPTALGGQSIATVPHIRRRAGEIDLLLYRARALLLGTARAWDELEDRPDARAEMDGALAAAKISAAGWAVEVAEQAMRLVGGSSMDRSSPLERHFRDVRGGLHHPPQEDASIELLAREALDGQW